MDRNFSLKSGKLLLHSDLKLDPGWRCDITHIGKVYALVDGNKHEIEVSGMEII